MKGQFHAVVEVQDKSVNALFFDYDGDNKVIYEIFHILNCGF